MSEKIPEQEIEELDTIFKEIALEPEENSQPEEELYSEKQNLILVDQNNRIKGIATDFTMPNHKHLFLKIKGILNIRLLYKKIKDTFSPSGFKGFARAITDKKYYQELLKTALLNKKLMIISISLGLVAGFVLAYI